MSKASNLQALRVVGQRVPPFVVVPASLFESFRQTLAAPLTATRILEAPLPASLAETILKQARELPAGPVAVRSSMAGEDSARHSFAGQLDSFLNVIGDEALLSAVKACWASAYGDRVLAYRQKHGLRAERVEMEVIVQVMVPAEVSGVVFTADPVARDPRWMVIAATPGLGEALVQGEVAGDTYRVNHDTGEVLGPGGVLSREQLNALAVTAGHIAAHFGAPQDIEFAFANGQCFILQSRPITTPIPTERMVWDNANITESYSGVTTPLTFSVIRGAYQQVYRQFLALMGTEGVDENVLRTMLGFYNGQVYYQLLNWYTALSWLPAFQQNRQFMEQMMGVKQSAGGGVPRGTSARRAWALVRWLIRMLGLHRSSQNRVNDFLNHFNAVLAEYQAKDFATFSPHQLRAAYFDLQERVLGRWQAPLLTDFFAMIFSGVLRRLCEKWLPTEHALNNDLLVGDGAIESLEPARQVLALAQQVRADPRLHAAFAADPAHTLIELRTRSEFAAFNTQVNEYLRLYGDRCMNELKLEEPNLRDDPTRLLRLIAAATQQPATLNTSSSARQQAEARLARLPWGQRHLLNWVVPHARRHVRNRENLRFARTRLFGLMRGVSNALGQQWAAAGILENPKDIYYLTIGEIWDFVEGAAVTQNLRGLVALRRAEFAAHKSTPLPDRFETFGVPYLDTPRDLAKQTPMGDDGLRGLGCCSGRVRARVRVVQSVEAVNDLTNTILVAERTDPGWVFLFPSAAGILVERGSLLSHSVIVAREMGKPIIVNVPRLTALIHTGDEVEMDGGTGEIWIHAKAEAV